MTTETMLDGTIIDYSSILDMPVCFDSYDEAYWFIKCYYYDALGYRLVIPAKNVENVIITLETNGSIVELREGWEISKDGVLINYSDYLEIKRTKQMVESIHPFKLNYFMGAFETMMYWSLDSKTKAALRKRKMVDATKTYLMHNPNNNLYKIGKSTNPRKRLKDMQGIVGNPLELLYVIDGDIEHELHRQFAIYNHFSEWFTDDGGSIQAYFKKNQSGGAK